MQLRNMKARPTEYCYWVQPNRLLAGEYPSDFDEESSRKNIDALVNAGVTAFIDLTEERDGLLPYAYFLDKKIISYERFPIRDHSVPRSHEYATGVLDAIDSHINTVKVANQDGDFVKFNAAIVLHALRLQILVKTTACQRIAKVEVFLMYVCRKMEA